MLHTLTYELHEVVPYINWLYFFHTWSLPSKYGSIARVHGCPACQQGWVQTFETKEQERAREALQLFQDAQQLLRELDGRFQTYARILLLPAYSQKEDIVVCKEDGTEQRLPMLRQQSPDKDNYCWCLSDFIQQKTEERNASSPYNQIGLFVSTVDKELEQQYPDDPYMKMLHQTLADRLAEATAEKAHLEVRKRLWGYAQSEDLSIDELFNEKYQGRRPAIGYPSLPDQSLNFVLAELLNFEELGIELTDSGAMRPHSSTSGLMLAHPKAHNFAIGRISDDQLADYANRRGLSIDRTRAFLSTNL